MKTLDYIIIGSGIAGLHTAYRLKQQGKKVLVLEKESYIGGRMSTRMVEGHPVDYGAKFVANRYKHMLPLAKELGVDLVPTNLLTFSLRRDGKLYPIDLPKRGSFLTWKGIALKAKLRLLLAVGWLLIKYRNIDPYKPESYLYLDDKSVYEDFRRLTGKEGFDYIIEPFSQNVIFHSTQDFSRAPFYSYLYYLLGLKTHSFPKGIGQLCQIMADELSVELNTQVKSVQRRQNGVSVTSFSHGGKEVVYEAKNAIIGVPGNHVLDILKDPLPEEKNFFSKIRYASTVQIIGITKTDLALKSPFIWTVPKENPNFSALSFKPWRTSSPDLKVFHASLKGFAYKSLLEAGAFNNVHLQDLIHKEFPSLTDISIIDMQIWESATPIAYPGYLTGAYNFFNRLNWNNGIYFCGDYLQSASTEGALTSSIKLLEKINGL